MVYGKIARIKHFISHIAQFSKVIKINYVFSFLSIIITLSQNKIMSNCSVKCCQWNYFMYDVSSLKFSKRAWNRGYFWSAPDRRVDKSTSIEKSTSRSVLSHWVESLCRPRGILMTHGPSFTTLRRPIAFLRQPGQDFVWVAREIAFCPQTSTFATRSS